MSRQAANPNSPTAAITQERRRKDSLQTQLLVVLCPLLLTCAGVSGSVLHLQHSSVFLYWPVALPFAFTFRPSSGGG